MGTTRSGPSLWEKVRGRSFDELRVRGIQLLHARAERYGVSSLDRIPSDAQFWSLLKSAPATTSKSHELLLEDFRLRSSPAFFPPFANTEESKRTLRQRFASQNEEVVLERADRILAGRFDLLGLKDLDFGQPINWHLEPLAGTSSPLVHWSQIDYLNSDLAGDKKIIWELNRHQFFATLGRAYWYTGNEEFAKSFSDHTQRWIEQNPPKLGINWASSLEVGFRSISWLWAIHFFRDSAHLTPSLFQQILKLLYVHARHLEKYLSTYFSPNTHLTGEALALFYIGLLLPQFRASSRWRAIGEEILLRELARHVRPDGVYFEQSSYYHRYTTDFYLHFMLLLQGNNLEVPDPLRQELAALLDHLMYITRPDGTSPLFGDDDGGKLMMLDESAPDDFRPTLATGAALFHRSDYKLVAREATEETLWLMGVQGLEQFDCLETTLPESGSRAFEHGGFYVMRDGWSQDDNYMLIDCGPLGGLKCGHAHADTLSFEVAAHGRTLLVDPGTFTYTGSKEDRDYFRSSAAHNTLTIDGESSSTSDGPFSWNRVANARTLKWISQPRFDFFMGQHDGYMRLSAPASHRRSILFLKSDYWVVVDEVETEGPHEYGLHFHLTDSARPEISGEYLFERPANQAGLEIFVGTNIGSWTVDNGWVSRCYRSRSAAAVPKFSFRADGTQKIATFLVPLGSALNSLSITRLETTQGYAFELVGGITRDLVFLGASSMSGKNEVFSDFDVAWLRFDHENQLEEVVLLDGGKLIVDGKHLVELSSPVAHFAKTFTSELIHEINDSMKQPEL
ncbi:MAG: heparinase II/III family protein [Pyrinomonadaceae bacterium]|nr:heparinase II/III family protein [Pyrinomonadaceae bacterium]